MKTILYLRNFVLIIFSFFVVSLHGQTITITFSGGMNTICSSDNITISSAFDSGNSNCNAGSYSWQFDDDGSGNFSEITSSKFSGVNDQTLTGSDITSNYDGIIFRLKVVLAGQAQDNCSAVGDSIFSNEITLSVNPPIDLIDNVDITPMNGSLCMGETYTLRAVPENNSNQIFWYDDPEMTNDDSIGEGTSTVAVSDEGTYFVRREIGQCVSEATDITITYFNTPPESINGTSPTNSVCPEDSTTLFVMGGADGTIRWYSEPDGMGTLLNIGNTYEDISPDVTTTYYVRSEGVCNLNSDELPMTVTVLESPPPLTDITITPTEFCESDTITLTATPDNNPGQINWYTASNGGSALQGTGNTLTIPAIAQTYYARRENGCNEGNSADVSGLVTPLPGPSAAFELPESICVGDTITVQTAQQDDASYEWNFANANTDDDTNSEGPISVFFSESGQSEISLTVTNPGCEVTSTNTITVLDGIQISIDNNALSDTPEFEIAANTVTIYELSSNFENVEYEWSCQLENGNLDGSAGSGSGATISNTWNLPDGEQQAELLCTVNVTAACEGTGEFRLIVRPLMFIPDVISVNGDGMNECWDINLASQMTYTTEDFTIKLYNRSGKCVRGCDDTFSIGDAKEWCGEGCPAGPYWYVIEGPDGFQETGALTLIR